MVLWLLLHKSNVHRATPPLPNFSNSGTSVKSRKGVTLMYNSIPKTASTCVWKVICDLKAKIVLMYNMLAFSPKTEGFHL